MIKKYLVRTLAFFLFSFLVSSCTNWFGITGSGNIVSENRTVTDFNSVEVASSADVEIIEGDTYSVEVSDYENIIQYLSLKVVDHKLIIYVDPSTTILTNSKAKVMITMPDTLKSLSIIGSGDIKINSAFKDIEQMSISGSGNIDATLRLEIRNLEATILGSGNISAKGNAESVKAVISGSGDIDLSDLQAYNADCTISGSGNIDVYVNNELKAKIIGSGDINYYGNPKTVNSNTDGSGDVIKK